MAKQTIGVGLVADDGSGDPLRTAFTKVNDNFGELYPLTFDAPRFLAHKIATSTGVTGDGTAVNILFDGVIFDQGANYDTATGLFTAPATGVYLFSYAVRLVGIGTGHGEIITRLVTSNRSLDGIRLDPSATAAGGRLGFAGTAIVDMDTNDTAGVQFIIGSGTKTVDLEGSSAAGMITWFSSHRIA